MGLFWAIRRSLIDSQVGFNRKNVQVTEVFDSEDMARVFIKNYSSQVFSAGQFVVFEYHGQTLRATVTGASLLDLGKTDRSGNASRPLGLLMEKTDITFIKASDSPIKIKGSSKKLGVLSHIDTSS